MPGVSPPWWHPERYAARRPLLIRRIRVIAAIRAYFAQEGFVEVETPEEQPMRRRTKGIGDSAGPEPNGTECAVTRH